MLEGLSQRQQGIVENTDFSDLDCIHEFQAMSQNGSGRDNKAGNPLDVIAQHFVTYKYPDMQGVIGWPWRADFQHFPIIRKTMAYLRSQVEPVAIVGELFQFPSGAGRIDMLMDKGVLQYI